MKLKAQFNKALTADDGTIEVTFNTRDKGAVLALKSLQGDVSVECKKWRRQRSLEANKYAWELIGKIAEVLKTDSESVYLNLLEDYGAFDKIPIWLPNVENERKKHRFLTECEQTVLTDKNNKEQTFVWCKCYRGSSEYDTLEMSRFIDGIIQEAKGLGIETRTPTEIAEMTASWKKGGETE